MQFNSMNRERGSVLELSLRYMPLSVNIQESWCLVIPIGLKKSVHRKLNPGTTSHPLSPFSSLLLLISSMIRFVYSELNIRAILNLFEMAFLINLMDSTNTDHRSSLATTMVYFFLIKNYQPTILM